MLRKSIWRALLLVIREYNMNLCECSNGPLFEYVFMRLFYARSFSLVFSHHTHNLIVLLECFSCTDNDAQRDSMDSLWYAHKYGLVDDAVFDQLWNHCGVRAPTVMAKGGPHLAAAELNAALKKRLRGDETPEQRRALAQSVLASHYQQHAPAALHDSPEA